MATTSFASLSVPAPDDTMEMSTPANRALDDDIDIDFEDYQPGGVQVTDDEHMLEDGDPTRPTTATDDIMHDDVQLLQQTNEEVMRDEGLQVEEEEDEELIDYGDDEFQEHPIHHHLLPHIVEEPPGLVDDHVPDEVIEEIAHEPPNVTEALQLPAPISTQDHVDNTETLAAVQDDVNIQVPGDSIEHPHADAYDETAVHDAFEEPAPIQDPTHPPIQPNTSLSESADTPDTPTDTGLHPMTLRYGDMHMPLFKSRRQPDGLLKDDNLANLSLAELVRNCREQLAYKIGEAISEDQEMLLGFDHMGLMLVEDCRAAFESSLNDVLEVYLQLHQNDGAADDIPPLSLTLSLQLKFRSSFSILKQAAAGGQGMSSFGFLHPHSDHHQHEYYHHHHHEEVDESDEQQHASGRPEDGLDAGEFDQAAPAEHFDGAAQEEDFAEGQYGHHEHGEEKFQADQEEEEEEYYDETAEGEYHHHHHEDQGEATAALDQLEEEQEAAEALYNVQEDPDGHVDDPDGHFSAAHDVAEDVLQQPASTASSYTVQGDTTAGRSADAQEDFSTFLTEYEDAKAADDDGGREGAQQFGSEDFLNEFTTGHDDDEEDYAADDGQLAPDGAGENNEQQREEAYDQADTYEHAQQDDEEEEFHPDYQPGEEEQYHTAHDFLDGGDYEHGLEHEQPPAEEEEFDDTVIIHRQEAQEEYPHDEEGEEQFGDDVEFEQRQRQQFDDVQQGESTSKKKKKKTGSPLGKRTFDEVDALEDDEEEVVVPEVKKVRSS